MDKKLIGKGMTAEVFKWDKGKVIKLFFKSVPEQLIEYEYRIGRLVNEANSPSPITYEIIELDGRKGIIYQYVGGNSLLKKLMDKPWKLKHYAYQMAECHANIHTLSIDELRNGKEMYANIINKLSIKEKDDIIKILETLPDGISVCHGDFHPDNIITTEEGLKTIDWSTAYLGHPASDVARTYLLIHTPYMDESTPKWLFYLSKILKNLFYFFYFKRYQKLTKIKKSDVKKWLVPLSCARLSEKIPGEQKWLLNIIKKGLRRSL